MFKDLGIINLDQGEEGDQEESESSSDRLADLDQEQHVEERISHLFLVE